MFVTPELSQTIKKYVGVLIDCDFLGDLYHNGELLKEIATLMGDKKMHLYPLTEFEFLRDIFVPTSRKLAEEFVSSKIFGHIKEETHLKIFPKLLGNAMLLSQLYAHNKGNQSNINSSFVDLLLAAILMYLKDKAVLITGNKKHFPSHIFDIEGILNYEENDGSIKPICVIRFNQEKFDTCSKKLEDLKKNQPEK